MKTTKSIINIMMMMMMMSLIIIIIMIIISGTLKTNALYVYFKVSHK